MTFAPQHRALKQQLEQSRPWLEEMATRLAERKIDVSGVDGAGPAPGKPGDAARAAVGGNQQSALKQKAMADFRACRRCSMCSARISRKWKRYRRRFHGWQLARLARRR